MPVAFSDAEKTMLLSLALPLPIERRSDFLQTVAQRLEATPEIGLGVTHRVARSVQREFFDPPRDLRAESRR
jgi:hypothetical protein